MSISIFIEKLQNANVDLTPREVAELLWLWVKTAPEEQEEDKTPESVPETSQLITSDLKNSSREQEISSSTVIETVSQPSKLDLYPKVIDQHFIKQTTLQEQRYSLQVPDAPAINNHKQLGRALKPLRRNFKSLREQELDDNKTVNTIVEQTLSNPTSPIWIPIFKPTLTHRWLNLVLVVEVNNSLLIWKQTIIELRQFFRRLGIFKSFETWGLQINLPKTQLSLEWLFKLILHNSSELLRYLILPHLKEGIQLFRYDDPQMRPYPPEAINSQGKDTLILLVSDLVSPAWYRSGIYTLLRLWSRKGMVNLLQLLPERLWSRTTLGQQNRLELRATVRTSTNRKLISLSSTKKAKLNEFKLPVTSLEPDRLEEWSRFLVGIGDNQCIGYGITLPKKPSQKIAQVSITPQERVTRFQSIASPTALKLAELLSAVLVTLPVIRVIQYTMLCQSNQSHVAEVLMGGLFQPLTETVTPHSDLDEIEFHFFPGVRKELLSWVTVDKITLAIEEVSAYIARRLGKSFQEFEVLLMSSPVAETDLAKQIRPFAQIQAQVLQQLGGEYAALGQQIQHKNSLGEDDTNFEKSVQFRQEAESLLGDDLQEFVKTKTPILVERLSETIASIILDNIAFPELLKWKSRSPYKTFNEAIEGIKDKCTESNLKTKLGYNSSYQKTLKDWVEKDLIEIMNGKLLQLCKKYGLKDFKIKDVDITTVSIDSKEISVISGSERFFSSSILNSADVLAALVALIAGIVTFTVIPTVLAIVIPLILSIASAISTTLVGIIIGILAAIPGIGWTILASSAGVGVAAFAAQGWQNMRDDISKTMMSYDLPKWVRNRVSDDKIKSALNDSRDSVKLEIESELKSSKTSTKIAESVADSLSPQIEKKIQEILYIIESR